jgi:hypothetical protein
MIMDERVRVGYCAIAACMAGMDFLAHAST